MIPGFALHWDLADLVAAIAPRNVLWTDPTDWTDAIVARRSGFAYRTFDEPDDRFLRQLLRR